MSSAADYIVPTCHEDVRILLEDEHFLLVNKPSGLLSVPGKNPANHDCLISRLQQQYSDALIVHRLDLDTSGIMVVARGKEAHRALSRQFQDRQTQKEYIAVTYGLIQDDHFSIHLPLICDWPNRPKQKVDTDVGKAALTHVEVISRDPIANQTRVKLTPITGRSHQLRVHLAEIHHPIAGCDFYAHEAGLSMSPRLLLHARVLTIAHPLSGELITGVAEPEF